MIDLGSLHRIKSVNIRWNGYAPAEYSIQYSDNGQTWSTDKTFYSDRTTNITHNMDRSGRYVRVLCTRANINMFNYSLTKFNVFGYSATK